MSGWYDEMTRRSGAEHPVRHWVLLGRQLWILFARNINAVPDPAVPVLSVILVAIGALVFANLDAALPGLDAAHTPAALALRSE